MKKLNKAYLLEGSNMEPRFDLIQQATDMINAEVGRVIQLSSVYESEAWGFDSDQKFLNQVLFIETHLVPAELLECILRIEKKLGRIRKAKEGYESRRIDIDILYFNDEIIDTPRLLVPHPRLHLRQFALVPLVEIAPNHLHPVLKKTNRELLECLDDRSEVMVFKEMQKDEI